MSVAKKLRETRRKLKRMGINPWYKIEKDRGWIVIDLKEFAATIKKRINYPNKKVYLEGDKLIIEVWK